MLKLALGTVATFASLLIAGACDTRAPRDVDDDGDGDGPGGSSTSATWAPEEICGQLLGCLARIDPNQVAALMPVYGESGSCWQTATDRGLCATTCSAQLAELHEAHWYEPACHACVSDGDCAERQVCRGGGCIERCDESMRGCCQELCVAARQRGCDSGWVCEPTCGDDWETATGDPCGLAFADALRCQAEAVPDGVVCAEETDLIAFSSLRVRCGHCVAESEALSAACSAFPDGLACVP